MAAIITGYRILSQPKYMKRLFWGWQWGHERQSKEVRLNLQFANCENQILCIQNIKTMHRHLKENYMIVNRIIQPRPGLVWEGVDTPQLHKFTGGYSHLTPFGVMKYRKKLSMPNHKITCFWRIFEDNVFFAHKLNIIFHGIFFCVETFIVIFINIALLHQLLYA